MEENILIVCSHTNINLSAYRDYYKIGVERGCLDLLDQGLTIDYACGDFDSVTEEEYNIIKTHSHEFVSFPPEKDYLDGELAIIYAKKRNPRQIILITDGPRLDMTLASAGLVAKYNIHLQNSKNYCQLLHQGKNIISPKIKYKYFSLISLDDALVDIEDMRYPAQNLKLTSLSTNAISNEFIPKTKGVINVHKGNVLAIYSQ
jgi:thiamine pyrophosphokinase